MQAKFLYDLGAPQLGLKSFKKLKFESNDFFKFRSLLQNIS
jgi:hypothetical protein